ncbi:MAG: replicative DNA helicase, partial [Gemmatimonadetes bacterium]|nr:replicative DNA helicase [Gemmatimonadota bacterium]
AIQQQACVALFSLEMSKEALVQRMLCAEAMVDSQRVRQGRLRDEDFTRLARAAGVLQNCELWIDDTPALSLLEMRSKARRLKIEHDIGLIIVDYLQLMRGPERSENRVQEISEISRSLKGLAKELDIPVVALSQLSRGPEHRADQRPRLADLRESGSLEQDADVVIFLYRDEYYHPDTEKQGIAEVIVGKNRNGPTGSVELVFLSEYMRFENLDPFHSTP